MAIPYTTYLLLAILIGRSTAQNYIHDVCWWSQLRAAAVRDALYVNGGDLFVNGGNAGLNGSTFFFNFSRSFTTNQTDFSALFTPLPAQTPTADYYDGTMFATDDKIYVYGYA
jgi:hypothetical protein